MAKEWEKFEADYKKLKGDIAKYTEKAGSVINTQLRQVKSDCDEGENNLVESMVGARQNGVTGTGLADFMKDKGFAEAKKLLDKAVNDLTPAIRNLMTFAENAAATADKVAILHNAIAKDLKSRKDKSETKKDIEKLQQQTAADHAELMKAAAYKDKPNKHTLSYVDNYMKTIDQLIKTAPEEAERKKSDTELPQLLVDRNIKTNFTKAVSGARKVTEACEQAIEAAGEGAKAAMPFLKTAKTELDKITEINTQYGEVVKKYGAALGNSKDKDKIEKMISAIAKSCETAERAFRGAATTIKKAG